MSKQQQKDMRRADLIVPPPPTSPAAAESDLQSTLSSTMPMAAIFTRNKLIGWTAVIYAIQTWLSETPEQKASSSSPAYMSIGLAMMSVGIAYMPLFMPPGAQKTMSVM